jgi:hypothetical protein
VSKVYVLTVNHDDKGTTAHTSIHSSEKKAMVFLAAYCRGEWENQGHEGHLSDDNERAVKQYFEYWDAEMSWDVEEGELDPDPADVEQSEEFAAGKAEDEFFDSEP